MKTSFTLSVVTTTRRFYRFFSTLGVICACALLGPSPAHAHTVYVGNPADPVINGAPDGLAPLVIMGEYNPSGPLPTTTQPLPSGIVEDVKLYGQNYDFTLYALEWIASSPNPNEQTFRVVAAQHFSGTNTDPGAITLAVSNFRVHDGDFLAFAGIGPYYPQQPNDASNTCATYEDSSQPYPSDNFTATPPVLGEQFSVGVNHDTGATYGYISDYYGNQGRTYAIGVDVRKSEPHFTGTSLRNVRWPGRNLQRLDFAGANLSGADLSGANLQGTDLSGADLQGADLEGALLDGANLSNANLTTANLINANLIDANLSGVSWDGANVSGVIFTQP